MNNPYMDSTTDDFVLSVNDVTPDAFGDVKLTISSMSGNAVENPQTNEVLQYDGSKWINKLLSLVGLSDCLITSPTTNQVLQYINSKWINSTFSTSVSDCADTSITLPSDGQILVYKLDSEKWTSCKFNIN